MWAHGAQGRRARSNSRHKMAAVLDAGRREAYFTMITTKDYIIGALVMAHSLRGSGATRPIFCMVTRNIEDKDLEALRAGGLTPVVVDSIPAPSLSHVSEWDNAGYTKINLWGLIEWDVVVYIDADCLVLSNMDDLFLRYGVLYWIPQEISTAD